MGKVLDSPNGRTSDSGLYYIIKKMTSDVLYCLSDQIMKSAGLYFMWCVLYLVNVIVLFSDSNGVPGDSNVHATNCRSFNVWTSLISHVYLVVSSANLIYGNKLPSTFMHIAGGFHQYSFWLLLGYYGGDVFHEWCPVAIVNVVYCFVVAIFTVDTIVKSWHLTLWPDSYEQYTEKWQKKSTTDSV